MTPETANPIIVALILLPFVICCLTMILAALNHWNKHREREPVYPQWTGACERCGTMENVGAGDLCGNCIEDEDERDWITGDEPKPFPPAYIDEEYTDTGDEEQ